MAKFFEAKSSKHNKYRSNKSAPLKMGKNSQKIEALPITRLSDDGRGISSYKGKTIFIDNALPGEEVEANVLFDKSNYGEGLAIAISSESTSRRQPQCQYFTQCGGCHLQHLDIQAQQHAKLENVLNKLKYVSHITPENILPVLSGDEYNYRQRARLSVVFDKKGVSLGFRKKNSKEIISIKQCEVLLPEFNQLIEPLYDWLVKHRPSVTHIEFSGRKGSVGIVIRHIKTIELSLRKKLGEKLKNYAVACWFQEKKASSLTDTNDLLVAPELDYNLQVILEDGVREVSFLYHPQDFIQTNAVVNNKMLNRAIDFLQAKKDHNILDLFCGVGNFSVPLSLACKHVIGVEGSDNMVNKAVKNAELNACANLSFKKANLFDEDVVKHLFKNVGKQKIESIILDPPRAGAKVVCQYIKKIYPKKILYVSCEPNTFARDAKVLVENGYVLKKMSAMDMFPQTYHNEVISLFVLKKQYSNSSKRELS